MTRHTEAKPVGVPTWCDLSTPDPAAARAFYSALFGWEYDIGGEEFGGYALARIGQYSAAGIVGAAPAAQPAPAAWNLYFASAQLEADVQRVVDLGGQVLSPALSVGEMGGMAVCADPLGAPFGFWKAGAHYGSQVTDEPGSTTWSELYSPNARQAREFYAALLGASADPLPGGLEYYVLKQGDKMLGGIMQIDPARGNFRAQWITYFAVVDTDKAVATATEHGGKDMGTTDDSPFGRLAALADPAGAFFKVIRPPAW